MKRLFEILALFLVVFAFDAKAESVKNAIEREFALNGIADHAEIEIFGGKSHFDTACEPECKLMVSNLRADNAQNKFSCLVELFIDGEKKEETFVQGKFYVLADAYIPAVNISKGEVITEEMLRQTSVRLNKVKPQNVIDLDKLAGKEARRSLREGKFINESDIGEKILIRKGTVVNMVYRTDSMQISAKAEALNDGSVGDRIEVMNTKSKKTLTADVVDSQTVRVDTGF